MRSSNTAMITERHLKQILREDISDVRSSTLREVRLYIESELIDRGEVGV